MVLVVFGRGVVLGRARIGTARRAIGAGLHGLEMYLELFELA